MASAVVRCAGCHSEITNRECLTCVQCKLTYDLLCANVSEKRFYNTMTLEYKQVWQCQECRCNTRKTDNTNTPAKAYDYSDGNITQRRKPPCTKAPTITANDLLQLDMSIDEHIQNNKSIFGDTLSPSPSVSHKQGAENIISTLDQLNTSLNEKLDNNMLSIITQLKSVIQQEINKATANLKLELAQQTESIIAEQSTMKDDITKLNITIKAMEMENIKIKNDLEHLQNKIKLNNRPHESLDETKTIVLYGLVEYQGESERDIHNRVINILYDSINVNLNGYIEEIKRIGKHGYRRPLAIELISKRMTKYLLQNNHLLKNTRFYLSAYLDEYDVCRDKLT